MQDLAPDGAGKAANAGFDAFILLIDSGISLHLWSNQHFFATVLFSCRRFDVVNALQSPVNNSGRCNLNTTPSDHAGGPPPRSFWVLGAVATVWNLLGVATYLMSVTMSPTAIQAMPEAERALYQNIPAWVTSSYAIAVFGGTIACVLLLLRKSWAVTLFALSLLAILLQMAYTLFVSPLLAVRGAAGAILPLCIIAAAVGLLWYARDARKRGWLG